MVSEIAWVGKLECGHTGGSAPPAYIEPEPPEDSVVAAQNRARSMFGGDSRPTATPAQPAARRYYPAPDLGASVFCHPCGELRIVMDLIFARPEPLPRIADRHAGTRW